MEYIQHLKHICFHAGCKQWDNNTETDVRIDKCRFENGTEFKPKTGDSIPKGAECDLICKV